MKRSKRMLALALAFVLTFLQMSEIAIAAEPKVTEITAASNTIGASGGSIALQVSGSGLTSDNWGIDAVAYIADTDIERPALKPTIKDITANSATLVIPQNTMKNDIEYRVSAGVMTAGKVQKEAEIIILQAGKTYDTVEMSPKSVVQTNATTIEVTFSENVLLASSDIYKLKQWIFVADYNNENSNRVDMGMDASVSVNGKVVKIDFAKTLELGTLSRIYIKEGALKIQSGEVLKTINWTITFVPTVTGISLDKEIFDHNGGTVVATLTGIKVDGIKQSQIEAKVFVPDIVQATDIPVAIAVENGKAPTLTFSVPGNDTDTTKCYFLQVKIDGNQVYEGTVENPAKKAAVSVLPEGVSDKEQTLGGATITGNNKLEGVGDNKNITVAVSSQEGELKTVMTLYGTNLDSKVTKVRAIDENGIIWPVYDIPE